MMITKRRLLALLLAVILALFPLASCNDDGNFDPDDNAGTNDEFTGSIADDSENGDEDDSESTVPPLAAGDENATVEISSYDDLKNKIARTGTFVLQNDIVISAADFKPLGTYVYPFLGTFDGNGHKITVTVNQSDAGIGFSSTFDFVYCGLFGVTRNATIKNLTVDINANAVSTEGNVFVLSGGIAGYMINTKVENCNVSGNISAKSEFFNAYAGNIAGVIQGGEVKDCNSLSAVVFAVDSENRATAGGIAGYIIEGTTVSKCNVTGEIKAISSKGVAYGGGLAGNAKHSSFTACSVDAPITATVSKYIATDKTHGVVFAGGIVGLASGDSVAKKASFTRCYILDKTVTATGNNNTAYAGGISAKVIFASFVHCYSLADIVFSTEKNDGFTGAAFGSLNSSGTENADKTSYIADFIVNGCFAGGGITATHKNPEKIRLNTSYGYIIDNSALANITKLFYNTSAVFTVNGAQIQDYDRNGTGKTHDFFTLENCISELGWNAEEWQLVGSVITAI